MSSPSASSPTPAVEQTTTENDDPAGVDYTAILPLEVMIYMLEVGTFSHRQLASLRLVNHALCDAASDPLFYRALECDSVVDLEALPLFVANSIHHLDMRGSEDINFEVLSDLMPNLTSLDAQYCRFTNVDRSNLALRELSLDLDSGQGIDLLSHLTNIEALGVISVDWVPPIASLTRLRRLSLRYFEGDAGELLTALASAPCAATLEALSLDMEYDSKVLPGWWAPLADLNNLREFGLEAPRGIVQPGSDADGFAGVLADHPTLAVLDLRIPKNIFEAVVRRGFPANVAVLGFDTSLYRGVEDLVVTLPTNLVALRAFSDRGKHSVADIRALLSRCPRLRAMNLRLDNEAVEYLVSGDLVDRPLLLNWICLPEGVGEAALTAAGHVAESVFVGIHWRITGGVVWNGEAAVF